MPRPQLLQARDVDILHSLSIGRFLTVQALEWLHVFHWRERWRRHLARKEAGETTTYYPCSNLYRRLEGLRAAGLVQTITRTAEQGRLAFTRLPDIYSLTASGAALLSRQRNIPLASLWYEPPRQRSLKNLEHSVLIGQCYAAVRAATEQHDVGPLHDWRGDHLLARGYDRVAVPGVKATVPVLPDASVQLGKTHYFVEIDRATRPLGSWREKAGAYQAYAGSTALRQRYNTDDFTVLIVAPDQKRLTRIAEEVTKVVRAPNNRYLLLPQPYLHPTRVRANWQQVAQVQWQPRTVIDRVALLPTVTLAPVALWQVGEQGANEGRK